MFEKKKLSGETAQKGSESLSLPSCLCIITTQRVFLADLPPSMSHWLHPPGEPKDCRTRSKLQPVGQQLGELWVLGLRPGFQEGRALEALPFIFKAHLPSRGLKDIFLINTFYF